MIENEETVIHVIVENNYITPVWFANTLKGLEETARSHKMSMCFVNDVHEIAPDANSVVLVGTTRSWIGTVLENARKRLLRPILIGAVPGSYGEDVSGTMYGSKSTIDEMVRYFYHYNRRRIALVDINRNSSNDSAKYESFLSTVKALNIQTGYNDVYFKGAGTYNPTEKFLKNIRDYDGVICSNDYSAAFILTYCREHGIRVPEDLFVAGLGDMAICRYTRPSLTSASRSYYEAGIQVYQIFRMLNRNPEVESIVTTMKSSLKPRGSTADLPAVRAITDAKTPSAESLETGFFVTDEANTIRGLEACLNQCDDKDLKLIAGILNRVSNESLAETLGCSVGTVNYRLKNLYKTAGVSTKSELAELIRRNLNVETLMQDAECPNWE